MKPAPFEYTRASSVSDAVRCLEQADGDGKIIAGGQSLTPVLALRMARPALLVDINRIPGLSTIRQQDAHTLRIGSLVRHTQLIEQARHPLLAEAARWIGHTAIRSRGTFGGSIAHADPSAELPLVATALDATVHIVGPSGSRTSTCDELFTGALETSLAEDEMINAVDLGIPERWGFAELSRRHGDFGLVTAVAAEIGGRWRVVLGGVASRPRRAHEAEALLNDATGTATSTVAEAAVTGLDFAEDIHSTADYRRAMTIEFTRRAVAQATTGTMRGAARCK